MPDIVDSPGIDDPTGAVGESTRPVSQLRRHADDPTGWTQTDNGMCIGREPVFHLIAERPSGHVEGWQRNGVPVVQRRSGSPPTAGAPLLLSGVSRCYRRRWAMSIDRWARR